MSVEPAACRICLEEEGLLVRPCACRGTSAYVHQACLERWVQESNREACEICHEAYAQQEVCGCDLKQYLVAISSFRPRSDVEEALLRMTPLHSVLGAVLISQIPIDDWMVTSSCKTLAIILTLILIQSYNYDVKYFVINVSFVWEAMYLLMYFIIGIIKTMDDMEMCEFDCEVRKKTCDATCELFPHYDRRSLVIVNAVLMEMYTFATLLGIKYIVLCFTHTRKIQYYNRNESEEEEALLKDDAETEEEV